ncbi:MAG: HAD family hydrolase [Sphingomonadaceae bacterium]
MTPDPIHAVLFDLDDTLWPIGPVIVAAEQSWHAWLTQHAPQVAQQFSIDDLRQRRLALLAEQPELAIDLAALRRRALQHAFALAGADPVHIDGAMQHFLAARNAVTPYPDVLPALARLPAQLKLGVITNGNADLEVIGMGHHFHYTLSSAQFGSAKPDPAIFLRACAALAVAPQHAVYVGDDLRLDVQGAQQAGLRAVWLNRHGSTAHLQAGIAPDAICSSLDDLLDWLAQQSLA